MKRLFTIFMVAWLTVNVSAQNESRPFRAYIVNDEFEVYMHINLYDESVTVPGQELYGPLPGYLGKQRNSFCWVITGSIIKDDQTAELSFINDYGSEDFKAELTCRDDSVYTLHHLSGSTLKVPKNGKWQKLPSTIVFKRRK